MSDFIILVLVGVATVFGISSCSNSDWYKAHEKEQAAKELAEMTPHVVREADGCKVYAFMSEQRYHYFTRCPDSKVTTESSYSIACGKGCSRTESEQIQTLPAAPKNGE